MRNSSLVIYRHPTITDSCPSKIKSLQRLAKIMEKLPKRSTFSVASLTAVLAHLTLSAGVLLITFLETSNLEGNILLITSQMETYAQSI
jgi:hypothetical protein